MDDGILQYKKAIEMKEDFVEAMSVLGVCYSERGQLIEALDLFLKARTANSKYAEAYFNAGNTYVKLGKYPEALAEYREAVKLDKDNFDFVYECAILEEECGDLDAALELWTRFMEFPEASVYWEKAKEAEDRLASVKRKLKKRK
ncbi:MAG: tetratricopeptide repeat protein [bacterium]|nr:tetratricopeptide repeat protein [bacterium]